MESKTNLCIIFVRKYKGKGLLIRPRGRCEKILKWALKITTMRGFRLDSSGSGLGPVADSCQHDNIPSSFIKCAAKWCGPVDTL
jgi:hypothetical protein